MRVHTETIGEPLGLVDVPASTQRKIDFLPRHEVRLLGLDHPKDGVKVVAVPSKATVDVVGHGAEIHGHLPRAENGEQIYFISVISDSRSSVRLTCSIPPSLR